ncbi:MAG: hypothetical protein CMJ38_00440 [Phycisphaerae bacterium]|nr:hypothetical protein [Phycisphaerae bacterium]
MINKKYLFFTGSSFFLLSLIYISIIYGPVNITISQIFNIIINNIFFSDYNASSYSAIQESVLLNIRFPRVILAVLVGGGLGTAGAILQGLFRNPLVDPGFIGVSSGAAVGAMIAIMFTKHIPTQIAPFSIPILAITGSFITTFIVYKMSKVFNKTNIMAMLLSGIAINAMSGSIIGLFVSVSNDSELRSFTFWTLGGLDSANWDIINLSLIFILIPCLTIYKMRSSLDIFMLGDSEAHNLGVNTELLKKIVILIASIIVGVSVAFCGMIGFVGLVTPHLVRLFIGPKHKYLIPGSALIGGTLLCLSDLISKTIISPAQLPVGVVTSAIGAPFFAWLIINQKKRFSYSD